VAGFDVEGDLAARSFDPELVDLPAVLIDEEVANPDAVDLDPIDAPERTFEPVRDRRELERAPDEVSRLASDRIAELRPRAAYPLQASRPLGPLSAARHRQRRIQDEN
jgi:hypothetical protein